MSKKEPTLAPQVTEIKTRANDQFKKGDFKKARALFTEAIGLEKSSPALYSNRSAANIKLQRYEDALKDAEKATKVRSTSPRLNHRESVLTNCILWIRAQLDPDWDKAQGRVATAQEYLGALSSILFSCFIG